MFPYLKPIKEFLKDCEGAKRCNSEKSSDCELCDECPKLVRILQDSVNRSNWKDIVKNSELKAWCQSVCFELANVLSSFAGSTLWVGLEYYLETREGFSDYKKPHYRADVMIGGYGEKNDRMIEERIMIIELKQYSKIVDIYEGKDKTVLWKWEFQKSDGNVIGDVTESPDSQVLFYCNNLIESLEDSEIAFFPCVYMHNLSDSKIAKSGTHTSISDHIFNDDRVKFNNQPIQVFLKDSHLEEYIKKTFNLSDPECSGKEVFKDLKKHYKTLTPDDLADILICDDSELQEYYIKKLRPDQYFILRGFTKNNNYWDNYIKRHIDFLFPFNRSINKNAGNNPKRRIVDLVEGGPGSGKTVLALLILRYCLDKGLRVEFLFRRSAPINSIFTSLMDRLKKESKDANNICKNNKSIKKIQDLLEEMKKNGKNVPSNYVRLRNLKIVYEENIDRRHSADVYIFDEAHTFDTKKSKNVLKWISKAKAPKATELVVMFYDKTQITGKKSEYFIDGLEDLLNGCGNKNKGDVREFNKYEMWSQFRCGADDGFLSWLLKAFEIEGTSTETIYDYDVEILDCNCNKDKKLIEDIIEKKEDRNFLVLTNKFDGESLSRLMNPEKKKKYQIKQWSPLFKPGLVKQSVSSKDKCIYIGDVTSVQGIESDEVMVIIEKGVFNNKTGRLKKINGFLKNRYIILLTRGLKKCYICCMDKGLKKYLEKID